MTTLLDLAKMTVSGTPGAGNITLGSAVTGWVTFATAGATNGQTVVYNVLDGAAQATETATYSTSGPSLTSRSNTLSTTGSLLTLTSGAIITGVARAEDILNKTGDTATGAINWNTQQTVSSASTTDIGSVVSNFLSISGTTTITSFGTVASGAARWVVFTGSLILTYNATSLILPGAQNLVTAPGDTAVFISEGSGNWRCYEYTRAANINIPPVCTAINFGGL